MNNKLEETIKRIQELYEKADRQKKIEIGWRLSGGKID